MSSPIASFDLLAVIDAAPLGDRAHFKLRQALVRDVGLDEATLLAKIKMLISMPVAFVGARFDLKVRGVEPESAFVIAVLDELECVTDLVAWPVTKPARMATFAGHATMLGEDQLEAWPILFAPPLPVHRTAVGWLRAGCVGIVPLDRRRTARACIDYDGDGELVAEDRAHAADLAAARAGLVDRAPPIMVAEPRPAERARAA